MKCYLCPRNGPTGNWRRERDSNPRYGFPYSGFQDRLFQPLTHPSDIDPGGFAPADPPTRSLAGPLTPRSVRAGSRFVYFLQASHIRPQGFGNDDGPVLLLVVLENRDERTADGQAGAVERVHVLHFAGAVRPKLDAGPARLETLRIAAGRNLAIGVLTGQPHLDVIGLRG